MTAVMQNNPSVTVADDEDDVALAAFLAPNWGRFDQDQLVSNICLPCTIPVAPARPRNRQSAYLKLTTRYFPHDDRLLISCLIVRLLLNIILQGNASLVVEIYKVCRNHHQPLYYVLETARVCLPYTNINQRLLLGERILQSIGLRLNVEMNLQSSVHLQVILDVKVLHLVHPIPLEMLHLGAHRHITQDPLIHIQHILLLRRQITKYQFHFSNNNKSLNELQLHFLFSHSLRLSSLKNVVHL